MALSQGMNVIVGDNGAGKSAVLEAIHMALGVPIGKGRSSWR